MAKIRLTKSELKKQREALKMYTRYLPTLQLKKQQLQSEVNRVQNALEHEQAEAEQLKREIYEWVDVFGEDVSIADLIHIKEIRTGEENISGIDIPIFKEIEFNVEKYDFILTPLWVDAGIEAVKETITKKVKIQIYMTQLELLKQELMTTTQRVNLFEKVKIPESRDNIKKINIFLGDLQTAEVVTGKIAKEKIQRKEAMVSA
jgi:V/A-type H+/Na+-transporting ATPase subunit D